LRKLSKRNDVLTILTKEKKKGKETKKEIWVIGDKLFVTKERKSVKVPTLPACKVCLNNI
jgi:hypothetical protein